MSKTVVGLFSTIAEAQQVRQSLIADGYESSHITVVANDADESSYEEDAEYASDSSTSANTKDNGNVGIGQKISNFFHGLTGGDKDVHHHYATGINDGGALLAVTTHDDEESSEIGALLKQHGARDIDDDYESGDEAYQSPASTGTTSSDGETAIPLVEEALVVGKRSVDRGGVRVYSHVTETPVSADVSLRDEFISVERRPVSRVATAADFEAGRGSVLELNATGEEAVVGKSARVVEEVLVSKGSSERTEVIQDSVRKTEVEVEEFAGSSTTNDR